MKPKKFRPNLKLDTTLSSTLAVKLVNPTDCIKYEPTKEVLETAKKAIMEYNREHIEKISIFMNFFTHHTHFTINLNHF